MSRRVPTTRRCPLRDASPDRVDPPSLPLRGLEDPSEWADSGSGPDRFGGCPAMTHRRISTRIARRRCGRGRENAAPPEGWPRITRRWTKRRAETRPSTIFPPAGRARTTKDETHRVMRSNYRPEAAIHGGISMPCHDNASTSTGRQSPPRRIFSEGVMRHVSVRSGFPGRIPSCSSAMRPRGPAASPRDRNASAPRRGLPEGRSHGFPRACVPDLCEWW